MKPDLTPPIRPGSVRGAAVLSLALSCALAATARPAAEDQKAAPASEAAAVAIDPSLVGIGGQGAVAVPSGAIVDEAEPNDGPASAQPLALPARVRANVYRAPFLATDIDVDVYSFTAPAGARLYAATMTSWSSAATDTHIDVLDTDGTTVIETDDDDGHASTLASNVGGVLLTTGGTYYVRVRQNLATSLTSTIRPYDLYVNLVTGTPAAEVEPNNSPGTATPLPANGWAGGTIDPAADQDWFSFTANAGDTIVAILDADPERDAPEWNPRVGIGIFNGFFFPVNGSTATTDANGSEAWFMTTKTSGTHYIYVDEAVAAGAPNFTYNVAVIVVPGRPLSCTTYTGVGGPITDLGITDFTLDVPDPRMIEYLRLSFNATHADVADIDISLISPEGNEVALWDDRTNATGVTPPQMDFVLEDEAGTPPTLFTSYSGLHWTPDDAVGRLAFFKGMPAQGTWTLRVRDDLATDTGTLNAWGIVVCEPAPRPACILPGPAETTVFSTDFETGDAGFTHSGVQDEWERGLPSFPPITTAHSGVNAFKTDLDGTYNSTADFDLVSPSLDLTTLGGRITLSFWHKFQMDNASNDTYWVEVREVGNPTNFRRVFSWTGDVMTRSMGSPIVVVQQSAGWGLVQADISDFAGLNVEVEYHLASNTSTTTNYAGVGVDDFLVTACTQVTGQTLSNVGITKTDGQATYYPGQTLTYTIVATNAGPDPVVGATVTDAFPADLTGVSWTCAASAGSSCGAASGTGDINTTVGLLSGGTATFTATATVSANPGPSIANTARITVPASTADPDLTNNTATDTDTLIAAAPVALAVDTAGNSVFDPNETAVMAPTWSNAGPAALALTGSLGSHSGPAGGTYTIPDSTADYGTIAVAGQSSCTSTGDCYGVANTITARPAAHVDSTVVETLTPQAAAPKTWTLHIGGSFSDAPASNIFYRFIETILHHSVTGGCTPATYCPLSDTSREQMAVFVLVSKEGAGYQPPACVAGSEMFADVPASSPFCRFIEELANRGVVTGCGGGNYCPTSPATREQMSVFVLRTLDPALNPPACVAGSEMFADVPASNPFCRWVEELARRGVVTGCGGGNYCPTLAVTREQMSVFLSVTFGLALYGV